MYGLEELLKGLGSGAGAAGAGGALSAGAPAMGMIGGGAEAAGAANAALPGANIPWTNPDGAWDVGKSLTEGGAGDALSAMGSNFKANLAKPGAGKELGQAMASPFSAPPSSGGKGGGTPPPTAPGPPAAQAGQQITQLSALPTRIGGRGREDDERKKRAPFAIY